MLNEINPHIFVVVIDETNIIFIPSNRIGWRTPTSEKTRSKGFLETLWDLGYRS
jgi:type IV secretory pathway ATPase VirB11/archaellum biosynthesis ATPase